MSVMKRVQRDLFEPMVAKAPLQPAIQAKLEPLLRSLLTEAVYGHRSNAAASPDEREGGDDQDHA
jgi:hypothetical protein